MVRCTLRLCQKFRESFAYPSKDVLHYFPRHMASGLKSMQHHLKRVDCLVEVHDARIPFSGRNPLFKETLVIRPHILVLNKMDLIDRTHADKIRGILSEQEGVENVIFTQCAALNKNSHHILQQELLPAITEAVHHSDRHHREGMKEYYVLLMGVPNVGKSSMINKLRQIFLQKKKGCHVTMFAGTTKAVSNILTIHRSPLIYMYDTPGVLQPQVPDVETAMKMALVGTMKDDLVNEDLIVDFMLFWLNKHGYFNYTKYYELAEPLDSVSELLAHVAERGNMVKRIKSTTTKGYEYRPDFIRAARQVLRDFREGKLGRFILDEDILRQKTQEHKLLEPSEEGYLL